MTQVVYTPGVQAAQDVLNEANKHADEMARDLVEMMPEDLRRRVEQAITLKKYGGAAGWTSYQGIFGGGGYGQTHQVPAIQTYGGQATASLGNQLFSGPSISVQPGTPVTTASPGTPGGFWSWVLGK